MATKESLEEKLDFLKRKTDAKDAALISISGLYEAGSVPKEISDVNTYTANSAIAFGAACNIAHELKKEMDYVIAYLSDGSKIHLCGSAKNIIVSHLDKNTYIAKEMDKEMEDLKSKISENEITITKNGEYLYGDIPNNMFSKETYFAMSSILYDAVPQIIGKPNVNVDSVVIGMKGAKVYIDKQDDKKRTVHFGKEIANDYSDFNKIAEEIRWA